MELSFFQEDITFSWKMENQIHQLITDLIREELDVTPGEISIIFCSDEYLLDINIRYLDHDYYTDIITFPYSASPLTADLYISIDRVKENADQLNQHFSKELCRVIIHGILHLCGYKDKTPTEKELMRSKEDHYLKVLQSAEKGKI